VVGSVRAAGRHPKTFAGADIATMQQQIGSQSLGAATDYGLRCDDASDPG